MQDLNIYELRPDFPDSYEDFDRKKNQKLIATLMITCVDYINVIYFLIQKKRNRYNLSITDHSTDLFLTSEAKFQVMPNQGQFFNLLINLENQSGEHLIDFHINHNSDKSIDQFTAVY